MFNSEVNRIKDEQASAMMKFCNTLSVIINVVFEKNKRDNEFEKLRNGYLTLKTETPSVIIEEAGPIVWQHREHIRSGDIHYFLSADLVESSADKFSDESQITRTQEIIDKVRMVWHIMTEPERKLLVTKFKELLSNYGEYVIVSKKLALNNQQ